MEFTGERYIPTEEGRIRLEHYHRYAIVLDVVKEKDILDVACGEGYGSSFMADVARSVVGVDICNEAVHHASVAYTKNNLTFRQGSLVALDFADASFDVVVSFETIEHLAEQAKMLAEIRRVLRPDGVLVISSPNRPVYSEESGEKNEFHVKELDFNEFDQLLKAQFPAIRYFGQRMLMGSVIQPLEGGQRSFRAWHNEGKDLRPNAGHLEEPVYFVAICGKSKRGLPSIDMSVLYPDKLDLIKHYVSFAKWAQTQDKLLVERNEHITALNFAIAARDGHIITINQAIAERDGNIETLNQAITECNKFIATLNQGNSERDLLITSLNQSIAERKEEIIDLHQAIIELSWQVGKLNQSIDERNQQINGLHQSIAERDWQIAEFKREIDTREEQAIGQDRQLKIVQAQYAQMVSSTSWRISLPVREVKRCFILSPEQQTKRYLRWSLRLTRRLYQALPLSYQTKEALRDKLAKHVPRLLSISGSHSAHLPKMSPSTTEQTIPEKMADPLDFETLPEMVPLITEQTVPDKITDLLDFATAIEIPVSKNPLVSVVIPAYGQVDYTLRCLASIAANPPKADFEVIVVDDCSPDNSVEVLSDVKGIRLIPNEQNQGFIRSCNSAASAAHGEYLYFLNNNTEVTPGWMDELLRTFQEFPGTGFVGSKLIYPDGRLQEAGCIIWQDGSAWSFGKFQDPLLPVYNYAREVDYCSGASIIVPKALFDELGGFDEHYLPACCEDSDLALKIRDKGYRVIYQALSTVIHYEGVTSFTDTLQGTKAFHAKNLKKIYERWKNRLQTHQPAGIDVDRAKDRRATRRVIVLDHCTPTPDQDSGSIDAYNIMLLLREMDFQVTFIPEHNFLYMPQYTTALQRAGIEVLYAPFFTSVEQHLKGCGDRYDLAFIFRPIVAESHIKAVRELCPKAKVLFHTVDLHFLRMNREAELTTDKSIEKAAEEMRRRELALIIAADITTVVSTQELAILSQYLPREQIRLLPYSRYTEGTNKGFNERKDIVFIGGYQHTPNVDAVQYFVSEIMPLLRQCLPGVNFYAVGSMVPAEIQALAAEDIIITGFVEELKPLLDKMRVSVAPLRYGAGIKGKIGSAMAVGLPVVATPLAAEGMSLTDGENILVADGAEAIADTVAKLYQDEILWNRLSHNGMEYAEYAWGAGAAWKILHDILKDISITTFRGAYPLSLFSESVIAKPEIKKPPNEI